MTAPAVGPDGPLYLTTGEVAARFRTSPSTVRQWRHEGHGPLGIRFGKHVLYPLPEVEAWEQGLYETAKRDQRRKSGAAIPLRNRRA